MGLAKHKTMLNYEDTEKEIEKKYHTKDTKKINQMKVSGKSVFKIKTIISDKSKKSKN